MDGGAEPAGTEDETTMGIDLQGFGETAGTMTHTSASRVLANGDDAQHRTRVEVRPHVPPPSLHVFAHDAQGTASLRQADAHNSRDAHEHHRSDHNVRKATSLDCQNVELSRQLYAHGAYPDYLSANAYSTWWTRRRALHGTAAGAYFDKADSSSGRPRQDDRCAATERASLHMSRRHDS